MIRYNLKQTGGTFLGIIIGLVIGLSIAVVVAVIVTKTPIPFINNVKKEKTADPTPGQMADPNKGLYGNKEAAKEAAKEFAKEPEPAVAAAASPTSPPAVPGAVAVKPVTPEGLTLVPAKPADAKDAAAKVEGVDEKMTYFLQVGAFRDQADAESTKAKLALMGFETRISERPSESGALLYRVRIGPFSQAEAMNKVRSKLSDSGVDVAVVRIPK